MTNEESRERTRLAVKMALGDLRQAMTLSGVNGLTLRTASQLNMLLHAPAEARGQESPEPSRRPPRPSERWTCADPNTRTRNGRAWVVDRVLRKLAMDVVVFRDPDDTEHSCHVGASQLREWSPMPEGTLREVARVREFIRHGPCELTNKLEEAGRWCPLVEGETHGTFRDRLAEALQAAGWHVGIPVVHAEEMLRRAKRLAPALPDVARDPKVPAATATATAAIVTCPDVVEGEYWEAPPKVVTCRMWRVREVMRFTSPDACAIVRMEDPRPDSPAGQRLLTASTMESNGWRRCPSSATRHAAVAKTRPLPKAGERWVCATSRTRSGEPWVAEGPTVTQGGPPSRRLRTETEEDFTWWFRDPSEDTTWREVTPSQLSEWSRAKCCPEWQGWVKIYHTATQVHVARCHVCRRYPDDVSLVAALDVAERRVVVHSTALWSRGEPEDRFYGFVGPEICDAYGRGEPGPFPRFLRPDRRARAATGVLRAREVDAGAAGPARRPRVAVLRARRSTPSARRRARGAKIVLDPCP